MPYNDIDILEAWKEGQLPDDLLQKAGVPSFQEWAKTTTWSAAPETYQPAPMTPKRPWENIESDFQKSWEQGQANIKNIVPTREQLTQRVPERPSWQEYTSSIIPPEAGPMAEEYTKPIAAYASLPVSQYKEKFTKPSKVISSYEQNVPELERMKREMLLDPLWIAGGGEAKVASKVAKEVPGVIDNVIKFLSKGTSEETILEALTKTKSLGEKLKAKDAKSLIEYAKTQVGDVAKAADISDWIKPITPPAEAQMASKIGGGTIPPKSPLSTVEAMWEQGRGKTPKDVPAGLLKLQENINDATYGLRRMQSQVEKTTTIEAGGAKDIKTLLTRSPGAANAGATRYILTIDEIKKVAPDIAANDINTIIYANHAKEVLTEKGAERVMAGGFKTTAELDTVLADLQTKLGVDKFTRAQQGAEVVQRVYQEELARLVKSGLINEDLGKELATKYPWYNPLQYIDDAEKLASQGKFAKPYTVISSGLKRLTETGTEKTAIAPLDVMADQLVKNEVRIHKNDTAKAIIQVALDDTKLGVKKMSTIRPVAQAGDQTIFRPGGGDMPGTISFFEDGVRKVYQVPDWMYREVDTLTKAISNPVSNLIGSLNGISRAAFTSASPPFVVANMLNDSLTAFMRGGILPTETISTLIRSLKGLEKDSVMQAFRLSSGYQQRYFGKDLAQQIIKNGGKTINGKEGIGQHILKFIPEAGEAGEQAPRMAFFKKQLDKTLPGWQKMTPEQIAKTPQGRVAAAGAVELTINFGRGGYLVKAANPFVIFLNASMEGAKLPFRTLRDIPNSRWRLAGVGAGLMGLNAYNLSYPEYMDIPNNIRWGSVVVMLPSKGKDQYGQTAPNYLTVIPRTREWGLFFGSTTYAMEKMFADNPAEFGKFAATMAPMLSPVSNLPVPQVIEELMSQQANWDFYYSEPIMPSWLAKLPPEQQTNQWVSPTIEGIANTINISPIRLQHGFTGLFGGAGQTALSLADYIARMISGEEQKGIPILSSVIKRVYPERGGQLYQNTQEQGAKKTTTKKSVAPWRQAETATKSTTKSKAPWR